MPSPMPTSTPFWTRVSRHSKQPVARRDDVRIVGSGRIGSAEVGRRMPDVPLIRKRPTVRLCVPGYRSAVDDAVAATPPPPPSPPELAGRRDALLDWFAGRARDFPWRADRTPYRVWVSEVMLQQTRAVTVVPYYRRWMDRFPSLEALAAAEEQEVLAAWEGLGYYRRARALHRAARELAASDRLPAGEDGWRALPGVGPYTAAAVAALAYGRRTVAVDGNVRRVGARLLASPAPRDAALRVALLPLVPETAPARGVEALIELGATVCTPHAPDCAACPLRPACAGAASGEPRRWPAPARRSATPTRRRWALAALDGGRVWLERRPPDGLLGGLWGLPQRDAPPPGRALPEVRHAYSHFRLELVPVVSEGAVPRPDDGCEARWVGSEELADLPLSVVDRAVLRRLAEAGLLASTA